MFYNAYEIVQFGWKKEAVPIVHEKKSLVLNSLVIWLICVFLETLVV